MMARKSRKSVSRRVQARRALRAIATAGRKHDAGTIENGCKDSDAAAAVVVGKRYPYYVNLPSSCCRRDAATAVQRLVIL